ncbi:MAG: 2-oxoglutarate ferredoxin oxidoreductase subunit alpha [Nitrospirae bacterium]|nr:MAG: 2-oxoglutarate ferredoxin oxidoreductase subunit alpha [Nitrospirota bacterium]
MARYLFGHLRKLGRRVGLFRQQTIYPFPQKQLSELVVKGQRMVVVEMNAGQVVDNVRLQLTAKLMLIISDAWESF